MSRTFKQQMGLEADPHAQEHVMAGSTRLTKVYTAGGHEVDTQQPGLPTYHRRIANPLPLMCIGVGASLLMQGLIYIGHRGLTSGQIFLNIGLPLGGVAVLTSCVAAFFSGNTFLSTTAGTLAGLLGGLSLVFLPWTGIQAAYVIGAQGNIQLGGLELYNAISICFFISFIPLIIVFLASLKTAAPVASSALLIAIALIILGVAYKDFPREAALKAGGALYIIIGVSLLYTAASVLLQEEGVKLLPVFPLPRHD